MAPDYWYAVTGDAKDWAGEIKRRRECNGPLGTEKRERDRELERERGKRERDRERERGGRERERGDTERVKEEGEGRQKEREERDRRERGGRKKERERSFIGAEAHSHALDWRCRFAEGCTFKRYPKTAVVSLETPVTQRSLTQLI